MDYKELINKIGFVQKNNYNLYLFTKNEYLSFVNAIVIDKNFSSISSNIFNKFVIFINPSDFYINKYILKFKTAIGIFINEIPNYALPYVNLKSDFGNFVIVNPVKNYPNSIWTTFSWYVPYIGKIPNNLDVKLNQKAMTSSLTFCDLFFISKTPTNMNVPFYIYDNLEVLENPKCETCEFRNICKYRIDKNYRNVYSTCEDYILIELKNINRLIKMYNKCDIIKMLEQEKSICNLEIKQRLYESFV